MLKFLFLFSLATNTASISLQEPSPRQRPSHLTTPSPLEICDRLPKSGSCSCLHERNWVFECMHRSRCTVSCDSSCKDKQVGWVFPKYENTNKQAENRRRLKEEDFCKSREACPCTAHDCRRLPFHFTKMVKGVCKT